MREGQRAKVSTTAKRALIYRCEWEHDGFAREWSDQDSCHSELVPVRKTTVKTFRSKAVAYRWMAERLIFSRRDELTTHEDEAGYPRGCKLCEDMPVHGNPYGEPEQELCKYHDPFGFDRLRKRLARWLRWRDSRREALDKENPCAK